MRVSLAISDACASGGRTWEDILGEASRAGFAAVELSAGTAADAAATLRSLDLRVAALRSAARGAGVRIGSTVEQTRHQAVELVTAELEAAAGLRCPLLTVPPASILSDDGRREDAPYPEALHATLVSLRRLAEEAAARGVVVAIEAVTDGFLLSPVECRELVDRMNSPNVGACVDLSAIARIGQPLDWIRTLRHRVACVRTGDDVDQDWADVQGALAEVGYAGPIVLAGDPVQASRVAERLR